MIKHLSKDIIKKYHELKSVNKTKKFFGISSNTVTKILKENKVKFYRDPQIKWTNEMVRREALKYKHRSEFMKFNSKAYHCARRRNILDDVCSHMEPLGDYFKRLVYAYEFEDNYVYVGLTYNKDKRHLEHLRDGRGPVYKHMIESGLEPKYKMISDYYIPYYDAQTLEKRTTEEYKETGWILLNSAPTGNLGGNVIKWTEDTLKTESLKYRTRKEMQLKNANAYSAIIQKDMKHLFSHMEWEGNIEHTLEECIEEAKKYTRKQDFKKGRYDLWQWTYKHGYSEIVFSHMKKERVLKWDTNTAIECAKKYKTVKEFMENDFKAYKHLRRTEYYNEATQHMIRPYVRPWKVEDALEISKKYTTLKEFKEKDPSAFNFLNKQENYIELTKHLKRLR